MIPDGGNLHADRVDGRFGLRCTAIASTCRRRNDPQTPARAAPKPRALGPGERPTSSREASTGATREDPLRACARGMMRPPLSTATGTRHRTATPRAETARSGSDDERRFHRRTRASRRVAPSLQSAPAERKDTMPRQSTMNRATKKKREGKAPSTQAGEFVREEIEHVREGKHGARNTKQAIAIGLSKARRAGVKLPAPKKSSSSGRTRAKAKQDLAAGRTGTTKRKSPTRSRATSRALSREGRSAASPRALSNQARSAASKRKRASTSHGRSATKSRAGTRTGSGSGAGTRTGGLRGVNTRRVARKTTRKSPARTTTKRRSTRAKSRP